MKSSLKSVVNYLSGPLVALKCISVSGTKTERTLKTRENDIAVCANPFDLPVEKSREASDSVWTPSYLATRLD
jgi:hypothetical protein